MTPGCQHCGQLHAPGMLNCPGTGFLMAAPGVIGKRVDRYEVERLLGVGGFGTVYRARHVHTDATVALKLLKPELGAKQATIDRFMREAKAASAIGSERIVGVLDAGIFEGQAFLALEFLDGWDLKDLVYREGNQDGERLVQIVLQVLEGLAVAHAKGIVHRDMKPANVFIVRRGDKDFVKLLDFGISKMHLGDAPGTEGLTMTGVAMGTPAYMAPEQFFDARSVDGRSDLYSVAVMLYELLAHRLPFEAKSYAELVVKVRTETPPPLSTIAPWVPPTLCAVVDKGLAREREQRWESAPQMAHALKAALVPGLRVPPRPVSVIRPPESQSMLLGQTAAPQRATPHVESHSMLSGKTATPAPAARPVVPQPMTPISFGPAPAAPIAPIVAAAAEGSKPINSKTWIWILVAVGIGGCCTCGTIGAAMNANQTQGE